MATLIGPFSKKETVKFWSGGDTTKEAFRKHIEEIDRIYGYLNALDIGKVSVADEGGLSTSIGNINTALTNHINNANPHPNYKPSVSWSDLTGTKPNLADLNGNLPMSRITGNLDASRITNLPTSGGGSEDGVTDSSLGDNGYVKFNNGLIINWGNMTISNPNNIQRPVVFAKAFPNFCFAVTLGDVWASDTAFRRMIQAMNVTKTGFDLAIQNPTNEGQTDYWKYLRCNYIAIGV